MVVAYALAWFTAVGYADAPLQSPHYQLEESTLGSGGLIQSTSPSYQSVESVGGAAIGNTGSTNYQVEGGSQTTADPALTFTVNNGTASFGFFSPTAAATATSTFSVSDYTSYGYVVDILGSPPSNEGHTITPMGTDADGGPQASQTGTNQFGINLVANTAPSAFGANPDHGQFGVGSAATNYNTPNKFRFVDGETIATGPKSSGITTYTISYLVNVDGLMPGGHYTSDLSLICIATY